MILWIYLIPLPPVRALQQKKGARALLSINFTVRFGTLTAHNTAYCVFRSLVNMHLPLAKKQIPFYPSSAIQVRINAATVSGFSLASWIAFSCISKRAFSSRLSSTSTPSCSAWRNAASRIAC